MRDIHTRKDIALIIEHFYDKLMQDDQLGKLFQAEIGDNLEAHLVKIIDFWAFNILGIREYKNNMFAAHVPLHQKWKLDEKKFDRWLSLFDQSIDKLHQGENANKMKTNAKGIAAVMRSKFDGKLINIIPH